MSVPPNDNTPWRLDVYKRQVDPGTEKARKELEERLEKRKEEKKMCIRDSYMSMIKEFMQLQYNSNNLSGYLSYKELYDYINDRTERCFN